MNAKLRKELEKQDTEELVRLIAEMSERFPIARMYLTMEFGFESSGIIEKYRKAIHREYFPGRGKGKARSSRVNKMLKEFFQIAAFQEERIEMRLYALENMVEYYRLYIHDYEPFLKNLFRHWLAYLQGAQAEGLFETHADRLNKMMTEKFKQYGVGQKMVEIETLVLSGMGSQEEMENLLLFSSE